MSSNDIGDIINSTLLLSADYISVLPIAFSFVCLLESVEKENYLENGLFLYWMYFSNGLTYLLKQMPYPESWHHWTFRPVGASNTDMLSRNGLKPWGTPGFPSGHMTSAALFSSYRIMRLWREDGKKPVKQFIKDNLSHILFYVGIVLATAWARWYKSCHNIPQIIGGFVVGLVQAVIFYNIYFNNIVKKE